MKDSRLVELLTKLNKKELRELGKFLNSPFHNQRQDVIELFEYLLRYLKTAKKIDIRKDKVFLEMFPGESYQEKKIRYTMSFLYQLVKSFLAIQIFTKDKITQQIATVKILRHKGIERLFEQEFRIAETMLAKQTYRNSTFHLHNHQLQQERYLFTMSQSRNTTIGLERLSQELDLYFISSKLKNSAHAFTHQSLNQSFFQPKFLDVILKSLKDKDYFEKPAVNIYYHCLKIQTEENALSYFQNLRQLIKKDGHYFPSKELQGIYVFALNYCIRQLNTQDAFFKREAFELYKEGVELGVFFDNNTISRFNYKNIVALGLGLKEYDWVANFIENYKTFLEKKYRESTYSFNLALLHYKKENYDEAMNLLQNISTDDVLNNLNARRMLARIYYDQGALDALYSLLDSFQNYIYRKKELGYHRELYLNFIKFMRRILQMSSYTTQQLNNLKKEIEANQNVVEKLWLLEQLEVQRS